MKGRLAAVVLAGGLALSGCGAAPALTAVQEVPELRTTLTKVDDAIAQHRYAAARKSLLAIIAQARAAEEDGTLSREAAARIVDSARRLLAQLPRTSSTAKQPSTPQVTTRTWTPEPSPSESATPSASAKPSPAKPRPTARPTAPGPAPAPSATPTPTPPPDPSPSATTSPAALSSPAS